MSKRTFIIGECLLVQLEPDRFEVSCWCDCIMARRDVGHWHLQGVFSSRADALAEVRRLESAPDQPHDDRNHQDDDEQLLESHGSNLTPTQCRWFALCDRPAVGVAGHPILGTVPICQRCADNLELEVTNGT